MAPSTMLAVAILAAAPDKVTLPALTPQATLEIVAVDLSRLPPNVSRHGIRYLPLSVVPKLRRASAIAAVGFLLNSVSSSPIGIPPDVVYVGKIPQFVRFNIRAYGITERAWEASARGDYIFTRTVKIPATRSRKAREVVITAPWVDQKLAASIAEQTGTLRSVVGLGAWVARAATSPAYYELAGIPNTLLELMKQQGVDTKSKALLDAMKAANLIRSNVTGKGRRIVRYPSPHGSFWVTFDVAKDTRDRDPIRNPREFKHDAAEVIFTKPNGMHGFALFRGDDKRVDVAPDNVVADRSEPRASDTQLRPLISCVRCHNLSKDSVGLRKFSNDQAALLRKTHLRLNPNSSANVLSLAAFYGRSLAKHLTRDREDYNEAVKQITGVTPQIAAAALNELFVQAVYSTVTPQIALVELGIVSSDVAAKMKTRDAAKLLRPAVERPDAYTTGNVGYQLIHLGQSQRGQWREGFADAMVFLLSR